MAEPVEEPMEEPMEQPVVELVAEIGGESKEPIVGAIVKQPIPPDPLDSIIWSTRLDLIDEDTVGPPMRNEIGSIGSLTAKLSDISSCIEKEMEYRKSEGKCKDFIHRFLRLIRSPVMMTLSIVNFVFLFLTFIMAIVVAILIAVNLSARSELKILEANKNEAACSVIWSPWTECNAECTDRHKDNYKLPTSQREMIYCYGKCAENEAGDCNKTMGMGFEDVVYCNLHSCKSSKQ
ncbi:hypothetical protein ACQ4LE_004891 [Meloidogyne hapla]|uniref:Defensin-like protein n=1 Tax=Meloidogyne hapla TaxID=6305 RepID=A0A1I8B1W2_MELHA